MALQKFFGGVEKLQNKSGEEVEVKSLEGKIVLLYCSAAWCPPCKAFTPKLAKFYNDLKAVRQDFEVVWVSSDNSADEFKAYFKDHAGWLALPYEHRKLKDRIHRKIKLQGIPTVAIIDTDGTVVSTKGKQHVLEDEAGKKFPWIPRKPFDILADTKVTAKDGRVLSVADFKQLDAVALYFAAAWAPPCRAFTPRLACLYNKIQATQRHKMEVIYLSSDKEESQYAEYSDEMPWATCIFQDPHVEELKQTLEVNALPTLVMLDSNGKVITSDARTAVADDNDGSMFPWKPQSLDGLTPFLPSREIVDALNNETCIVLSSNGASNKESSFAEFKRAAEHYESEVNAKAVEKTRFFHVVDGQSESAALFERLLHALSAQAPRAGQAVVMAFNVGNKRSREFLSGEVSESGVTQLATRFSKAMEDTD